MNKFQKLAQLNKDIELLENAGKIKAADILHQKFIKEAQYAMPQMMTTMMPQMMMPQMMMPQMMPQMMPMTMARPVAPGAVARPVVAPAAVAKPVGTPAPVQQGQVNPPATGITPPTPSPAPSPAPNPAPTPKPSPGNMQIEPPNPMDDTQRGYGDQQSKNQEMQYLMNEKKRLEEMGATQPNSPYYQQYQTILEMIKRNQGGSVIKKSENMNKLQKLAQLNQDIELLETAGKFKAAEILQKKFLKEAQVKPKKDLMNEFNLLAQNQNQDFDDLVDWRGRNYLSYSSDDQVLVNKTIQDAKSRREKIGTFSTSIQPENPTLTSYKITEPYKTNNSTPTPTPTPTPVATPTPGNAQDTNRNYQQEAVDAQKMRDRVKYYSDKINEYNAVDVKTLEGRRKKSRMKVWLSKYIQDNYNNKLIDEASYNKFMNALGKKYLAQAKDPSPTPSVIDPSPTPSVIPGF